MMNLKKENGSIAVMVFITVLFMITILSATYIMTSTQRKSQLKSQIELKSTYGADIGREEEIEAELNEAYFQLEH